MLVFKPVFTKHRSCELGVLGVSVVFFLRVKDAKEKGSHLPAGSLLANG